MSFYTWVSNVFILTLKEIKSLCTDLILVALIAYLFTVAVVVAARGGSQDVRNAPVAFADHDGSELSRNLRRAVLAPYFKPPETIADAEVQRRLDVGDYYFVADVPPGYEEDLLAGKEPKLQLMVDATSMTLAATGTGYLVSMLGDELEEFANRAGRGAAPPAEAPPRAEPVVNVLFNPNSEGLWQMGLAQIIGNTTLLTLMLTGAAVIREKERGTIEHLLVMPVSSSQIAAAKIAANSAVTVAVALVSLWLVVHRGLGVPVNGSVWLVGLGMLVYALSFSSLGILLAINAPSLPQFGLLCIPVYMLVYLLSGATSPVESMPDFMRSAIQISPTTQMVAFTQDVVYRGAAFAEVYPKLIIMLVQGVIFLIPALAGFRSMLARQ